MTLQWKSLFRFRIRTMLLWLVLLAVGWSAYSYWSDYRDRAERAARELLSPPAGAKCTVVFNSTSDSINGLFSQLNDDWIVLDSLDGKGPQQWVSMQNVLLLEVEE